MKATFYEDDTNVIPEYINKMSDDELKTFIKEREEAAKKRHEAHLKNNV